MNTSSETRNSCIQLLTVSFITLFLELMIIRWVPSNIRLIAYYSNLMLISSFLGIGLGALLKGKTLNLFTLFPFILLADIALLIICRKFTLPGFTIECRFYSVPPTIINFTIVVCIFLLNAALFVPLGEKIGQLFDALPPLKAYSWDIGGSLLGTVAFGFFSVMFFSPVIGFILVFALYLLLIPNRSKWIALTPLLLSLSGAYFFTPTEAIWSPYYYVTINELNKPGNIRVTDVPDTILTMKDPPIYRVIVNQGFYQRQGTINVERYTKGTKKYADTENEFTHVTLPYQLKPNPERVLVVGAGGGKDIEAAFLMGAQYVDAVEIDPLLIEISKKINASGVYFDPRVHIAINDARAFFSKAKPVYDIVAFAYLDASTLFTSMSNIRLDGYVYTIESLRTAYSLVKDDGLLSVSFASGAEWMMDKLILMLMEATGKTPIVYTLEGQYPYKFGPIVIQVPKGNLAPPENHGHFKLITIPPALKDATDISLATDDWPFLYLKKKGVPIDYLAVILILTLISSVVLFATARMKWGMDQTHFFFLGAGFLLLETKSITDCSLYFGATWFVTMLVVAGILLMVLCANILAMRLRSFSPYFFLPLIASMLLLYTTPHDFILGLPFVLRLVWVLIFVPLPVFFAGLIFSTTFRESKNASSCFGANLIGATIGGFAEYLGMAIGFQNLSLLVITAYLASFFTITVMRGRS